MRRFTAIFLSTLLAASAQQVGQNAQSPASAATFQTSTQLVV